MKPIPKNEKEWKCALTPEKFHVLREKGTERAFSGKYYDHHEKGDYKCAGCGQILFHSSHKFDSGTGWPSFFKPAKDASIVTHRDQSHGMERIEVLCSRCQGHLGHVFEDGPAPTHKRFCINSEALDFESEKKEGSEKL